MNRNDGSLERWRFPLAIFLSFLTIFIWSYLNRSSEKEEETVSKKQSIVNKKERALQEQGTEKKLLIVEEPSFKENDAIKKNFERAKFFQLENDQLKIVFSSYNGIITQSILKEKGEEAFSFDGNSLPFYESGNLSFYSVEHKGEDILFVLKEKTKDRLVLEGRVKLSKNRFTVRKEYFLKDYELGLKVTLINGGGGNFSGSYYLFNGSFIGEKEVGKKDLFNIGKISYNIKTDLEDIFQRGFLSMFSQEKTHENILSLVDWISIDNRFYARILKGNPRGHEAEFFKIERRDEIHQVGAYKVYFKLSAFGAESQQFSYFFFPKKRDLLDTFYDQKREYFFNLFRQMSLMRIISSWMYWLLMGINSQINNFGFAIILMTLMIKIITFPLTMKSYKSMHKMQFLAPKMNHIKAQYKNNKQKANQEVMALYKKEKVNPMGGCLPMLIPIPIFIALYSLFQNMVELKGESFLWINDLTKPDIIFSLPFSLPFLGQGIHFLPILMMVSQFVQSFLTPQPQNPSADASAMKQQAFLMKYFMPIFFFFICWPMPSALILFWTAQNIFSIFQSFFLLKKTKLEG